VRGAPAVVPLRRPFGASGRRGDRGRRRGDRSADERDRKGSDVNVSTGAEVRRLARSGEWKSPTSGIAPGYVQANLLCVPRDRAFAFRLFCRRNPRPCPLLDVTDPGDPEPKAVAPGADLRFDVPRYRAYRYGELISECDDLTAWWRDDLVAFLLGCSFTF